MTSDARIGQLSREVLAAGDAVVRVGQVGRQALLAENPPVRIGQLGRQVLAAENTPVRIGQVYRSVLRSLRDAPYPIFPSRYFSPPSFAARIVGGALSGPADLSGDAAMEALASGGRWVVEFGASALLTPRAVQTWRQFVGACDLGAMSCIVPIWDRRHQTFAPVAYTGDDLFGTQVFGPVYSPGIVGQVNARVAADAARHAREITFDYAGPQDPTGGEHFSIYGGRYGWSLYRLIRITARDGDRLTAEIRPGLREYAGARTRLNFDAPRCTMRIDGDPAETLELLRFAEAPIRFVETFNRYP